MSAEEDRIPVWPVTPTQRTWFIAIFLTLVAVGLAWQAHYWLIYLDFPPDTTNVERGYVHTYIQQRIEVMVFRIGSVGLTSAVLSAILLLLWDLGRGICRVILRVVKPSDQV